MTVVPRQPPNLPPPPQYVIIQNPENGSPCPVCKRPVWLTNDGWRDEHGQGTHHAPTLAPPTK